MVPVTVAEGGEDGGKGFGVSGQILKAGHGYGCEGEGGAVSGEGGHGGDGAALVFEEVREGLFGRFADWFQSVGEGEFDVACCLIEAVGYVGNDFDNFVGKEAIGCQV